MRPSADSRSPVTPVTLVKADGHTTTTSEISVTLERIVSEGRAFRYPSGPRLAGSAHAYGRQPVDAFVTDHLQEAVETVKLLLGIGAPLIGRMLYYDALAARFSELKLTRDRNCRYCGEGAAFPGYADYEEFCNAASA